MGNLALWTLQAWIAMFLIAAGYAKIAEPMTSLEGLLRWARPEQETLVRTLGWIEIALGLSPLAPLVLRRDGRSLLLIGVASVTALSLGMIVLHSFRGEPGAVVVNLLLLGAALIVFIGRRAAAARP